MATRLGMLAYEMLLLTFCFYLFSSASGGIEDPILIRYPELGAASAPSWLHEGVRATYYVIAAPPAGEMEKTGNGLMQIDVVALEGGKAAINTEQYAPYPNGGMRPILNMGSVAPEGCGDFWCNPEVCRRFQTKQTTPA
jgi:hypothetical protein